MGLLLLAGSLLVALPENGSGVTKSTDLMEECSTDEKKKLSAQQFNYFKQMKLNEDCYFI